MSTVIPMRNHWWWRPGWHMGRSFYTWHITFAHSPGAQQLASAYAPLLASLPTLDPIPPRWLHLTLQGIGFIDEVQRADVEAIVRAARRRCSTLPPFTVELGPARLDPETIQMPAEPIGPVSELRSTIRAAIGDVWGADNVPEPEEGFRAHVSLAYSNRACPAEPLADALARHGHHTAEVMVATVSLIDLNRDHQAYEWTELATVPLGHS